MIVNIFLNFLRKKNGKKLNELFINKKEEEFKRMIDNKLNNLRSYYNKLNELAKSLKEAYNNKPKMLEQLFCYLDWYGLVECKLPNMEDYGKVIEKYDRNIVLQYFCDKISKAPNHQKKALKKMLEYIQELYEAKLSREEIAYFVRKINSLEEFWRLIK